MKGPHPWGSLNWRRGAEPADGLGEVLGAKRPWRDGSRPANACTGVALVTVPCQPTPIPAVLYATITVGNTSQTFQLFNAGNVWIGDSLVSVGVCGALHAELSCEEVPFPPGAISFGWQLRTHSFAGPVEASDGAGFNPGAARPLVFQADLPSTYAVCFGGLGPMPSLTITEENPARTGLGLV